MRVVHSSERHPSPEDTVQLKSLSEAVLTITNRGDGVVFGWADPGQTCRLKGFWWLDMKDDSPPTLVPSIEDTRQVEI